MDDYDRIISLWSRKNITTNAELAVELRQFRIDFSYHSVRLAKAETTYEDTRAVFRRERAYGFECDTLTLFDIRNARDAYEVFLIAFGDNRPLDEALMKVFQYRLTRHTFSASHFSAGEKPGTYRTGDDVVDEGRSGIEAKRVPKEMELLLRKINRMPSGPENALRRAGTFLAEFLRILPFADGNGRTARLALNYLLVLSGHPPVIIGEEGYDQLQDALDRWNDEKTAEPVFSFLRAQTVKTWSRGGEDKTNGQNSIKTR